MRLLSLNEKGEFHLTLFADERALPLYAILSHTWGKEEVLYQDIIQSTGKSKDGYRKLEFCAKQAGKDGLRYFWIDTCCIDKANYTELTQALNSMFRWYKGAVRCYAFMSDVEGIQVLHHPGIATDGRTDFQHSRWFTRGWTLQELLAPTQVHFFSSNSEYLGDKLSLETQICAVTGIGIEALRTPDFSKFTLEERMTWVEERETTIPEDKVYCMLGICDVSMPVIYGEGYRKAKRRLEIAVSDFSQTIVPVVPNRDDGVFMTPFERTDNFVGREAELAELENCAARRDKTTKIAVFGLGGVGKTRMIVELTHRIRKQQADCSVIWVSMASFDTCKHNFRQAADELELPASDNDDFGCIQMVMSHLSSPSAGRWILVFDNADDLETWNRPLSFADGKRSLAQCLPRNKHGCIILNTRDRRVATRLDADKVLELTRLDEETASAMLRRRLLLPALLDDRTAKLSLFRSTDFLPLALVHAAAYINEMGITLADYVSLFCECEMQAVELLSEEFEDESSGRPLAVANTWLITFDRMQKHHPRAAEYLSFLACLNPKAIPQSLLPEAPSLKQSLKQKLEALGILTAFSFVTKNDKSSTVEMHRLVHLTTRNWLQRQGLFRMTHIKVMSRVDTLLPRAEFQRRSQWRDLCAHASMVISDSRRFEWSELQHRFLSNCADWHLLDGNFQTAADYFEKVTSDNIVHFGETHIDTLRSMHSLAVVRTEQARYKEAEEILLPALVELGLMSGRSHTATLEGLASLAAIYRGQGRYEEERRLEMAILNLRYQNTRNLQDPSILGSVHSLACLAFAGNHLQEAEALNKEVLTICTRIHGPSHPLTLRSACNLAATYTQQGRAAEAEPLLLMAIPLWARTYGEQHPDTLRAMDNLGVVYHRQSRWAEAFAWNARVLRGRMKVLGENHPYTKSSLHEYRLLKKMNQEMAQAPYATPGDLRLVTVTDMRPAPPRHTLSTPDSAMTRQDRRYMYACPYQSRDLKSLRRIKLYTKSRSEKTSTSSASEVPWITRLVKRASTVDIEAEIFGPLRASASGRSFLALLKADNRDADGAQGANGSSLELPEE